MQRKSLILVVASLTVFASIGGASAAAFGQQGVDPDTGLGGLAQDTGSLLGGMPDQVATYGGVPGWHVAVSDRSALENWANSSDEREILRYDNGSNTAVIRASPSDIGTGWLDRAMGQTLVERSYVDSVAVVQEIEAPEPPEPVSREQFAAPTSGGLFASLGVDIPGLGGPDYATKGIAFTEDANKSTLSEARGTMNEHATRDGSAVDIAILDDGVTYDQSLYGDRFVDARDFVADRPGVAANNWENVSSASGHGSWVASAIAANATNDSYSGVVPDADLYPAKVLGNNGGTSADIVDGLRWACGEKEVDIVSMSLGSQVYSAPIDAAVQDCVDNGTLVVVAAGNSAGTIPVGIASPADSLGEDAQTDGIITVAATNVTTDPSDAGVAHFSQRGPDPGAASTTFGATRGADPTLAAPGMEITAMTAEGKRTLSGTSMATPLVTGAAAVILDTHNDQTVSTVEQRLAHGATPINGSGYHEVGAGMVDVMGALNTEPSPEQNYYDDQREARTEAAEIRDDAYEGLAVDARGQWAGVQEAIAG